MARPGAAPVPLWLGLWTCPFPVDPWPGRRTAFARTARGRSATVSRLLTSISAARRQAFAKHFAFPLGDRLETVLDDASIDAVAILTPPNTHRKSTGFQPMERWNRSAIHARSEIG